MSIFKSDTVDTSTPRKLRLCYISNPNLIHTRRWVTWFASRGHTVCLLADVPLKEPWSDVPVIDVSKIFYARYIRFPVWTVWLRNFIRKWQPDILHAHRINSAGWMAAASGFHPYIVTPWGVDIFVQPFNSWLARFLAQYTVRKADLVTSLSDVMGKELLNLGATQDKLHKIQFGVEMEIFKPEANNNVDLLDLRRRLSLPENARVVLSPRAVTPLYSLDIIMQAIPLIRQRVPEAYFIFLDYNTEMEYKQQLEQLSNSLGIDPIIRWVTAIRSRSEMAKLYQLSDVVLSIPSTDGTPVSVMEAMACGKPVVSTDLPPLREFISDGRNGWLVPVREIHLLAERTIQLLEQPELAKEFGQLAHQTVAEKANTATEMQRMETLYNQLTGLKRK
jgi:glycosyltransferase involved in cell wall biosynthesis